MNTRRITIKDVFKRKDEYLIKILLLIYILSFLGATYNHIMDLFKYGLFPYQKINQNVSLFLNIYWTMLTLFDFIAILVLVFFIDIGLLLYGIIIISDVIINYSFILSTMGIWDLINFGQISQMLFLIVYICTSCYIHKRTQEFKK